MTGKERLKKAVNFEESDRIPFDIGATTVSSFSKIAFENACRVKGIIAESEDINSLDPIQQIVQPSEKMKEVFCIDTYRIGAPRLAGPEITSPYLENGIYNLEDQFGCRWTFNPKKNFYYNIVDSPLQDYISLKEGLNNFKFPKFSDAKDEVRAVLNRQISGVQDQGIVADRNCAGLTEIAFRIRGYENFFIDMALDPEDSAILLETILEYKLDYWTFFAEFVREKGLDSEIIVAVECDDLGTQDSLLFSPEMIRTQVLPLESTLIRHIKRELPDVKVMFHSDGAIFPLIPDFIEMGVDILNPVQFTAAGMGLKRLKKEYGRDMVFWGGGVDTQHTLPYSTPGKVADEVKRNIDLLAPGGGFVFATVHNIQADVPGENFWAMWDTVMQYKKGA